MPPSSESQSDSSHSEAATPALNVVALAASAGGLEAIRHVLGGLPDNFPAAIVVVQHLHPNRSSVMASILGRATRLTVKQAEEGDRLQRGFVYIAPPNRHLLANPDGTLSLSQSEMVHFLRPSADLLLESVAASYGASAIAVVLSGTGADGTMGMRAIKKRGGTGIAQDPSSAQFPGMPEAAVKSGCLDMVLPLDSIAPALLRLVSKDSE